MKPKPSEVLRLAVKKGWLRAYTEAGKADYMAAIHFIEKARAEDWQFESQEMDRAIALAEEKEAEG